MVLQVCKTQLFVKEQGTGAPLLFLHGNPDTADVWDEVIHRLHPLYRCIAPDLPGFGRSAALPDRDASFESLGEFVDHLLEAAGVDLPLNLVTHDFGGAFGMAWAAQHPDKVRRLVIINHPFFIGDYRWHIWARIWRTPVLGELSLQAMCSPAFYRIVRYGSRQLTHESIRQAYSSISPQWKRTVLRLYRAANPADFRAWEPRMRRMTAQVPTLVLWGMHDPWVPRWVADRFGAQRVVELPDCGHWPPAEGPERVATEIREFARP